MASSRLPLLLLLLLTFTFLQPLLSIPNLRRPTSRFRPRSNISGANSLLAADGHPTTYFEVGKPIPFPKTQPCSYLVLQHDFAYTYGQPPVLANFKPPSDCRSQNFAKIVLEWTATCKGRQFDRIFGVWVGGVEILRSCTAEPRASGIVWTVKKDITKYASLLTREQTVAVYLGNLIDETYTGVYHVNLTFHFYPAEENFSRSSVETCGSGADLILPISRNLPLNDGLWFQIQNSSDVKGKEFKIPRNAYRAVLEVYVSFHENDEFWYGNVVSEYISANGLTTAGFGGNGPFREVIVGLDDTIVGAIWPFTVIFTGGVNPLLWRPITAIGSFNLPTYDIEITPFLGKLLDGKAHNLTFNTTNALNVWYIDANLHIWLDKKRERTEGELLKHSISPLSMSLLSKFAGPNGSFVTKASRLINSSGRVTSSHGVITTESHQKFGYTNDMVLGNDAKLQILNQMIKIKGGVEAKLPSSSLQYSTESVSKYRFYMHYDSSDKGNGTQVDTANVTLGMDENSRRISSSGTSTQSLKNWQRANGYLIIPKDKNYSGLASTEQDYHYSGDGSCYSRKVKSSNYTILYDEESKKC